MARMVGAKKARHVASITNFKQVGIKAGLAPSATGPDIMFRAYNIGGAPQTKLYLPPNINMWAAAGLTSHNPAGSGGVGRKYPISALNFA